MAKPQCPTDRLPLMIQDELSPEESSHVLAHLEECSSCQASLETLTADATWWERTARGLSGTAIDNRGGLPEAHTSTGFVETLLDASSPGSALVLSENSEQALLDPPSHQEMLGRIDEFDIEEKIGQGGMGIVYRGFDRSLNRPVAVKVMAPHLGSNGVARKRFAREAQAAAAVVHPHVVPIYRVNSSPERPYIAMALVDGHSLQDHVTEHGPLAAIDIVRISVQAADGLAAAHRQGLIHRDMKPANILMDKDVSRIMITDFGLARAVDEVAMTQSGCLAGTPNYMSPEQVKGADIDHRSDLFSLGGVMYFLATGREPFRAESAYAVLNKITNEIPSSARSINADVPETLDRIIGRLLEKEPADRIESAEALQQLLAEYLAHLQDPQRNAEPQVKATRSERAKVLKRFGWGLAAFGIVLAMWFAGIFSPEPPDPVGEHAAPGVHDMQEGPDHHDGEEHGQGSSEEHGHDTSHD
jgi:eukaryotic-like serine/threonine-protein kinase